MDSLKDNIQEAAPDGTATVPLGAFFAVLQQNGFSVTPAQIINANRVIIQYANWVKNEAQLCMYLSPLFASSEDEQILFEKLFKENFKSYSLNIYPEKKRVVSVEERVKKNWKKLLAAYIAICLLVVFIIISTSLRRNKIFDPYKIEVSIWDKKDPSKETNNLFPFATKTNDKLELVTSCRYNEKKSDLLETMVLFNWGDSTEINALPSHIYIKPGKYHLTAYINVLYKNNSLRKDTLHRTVNVCSSINSLNVKIIPAADSLIKDKEIKLQAITTANDKLHKLEWHVDNDKVYKGKEITVQFKQAGSHTIRCIAVYDSINSPCNIEKYINLIIHDKKDFLKVDKKPDTALSKQEVSTTTEKRNYNFLLYLYKTLAAIFIILAAFFIWMWNKELKNAGKIKTIVLDKYKKLAGSLTSKKTPSVLPFRNRNYLPVHEQEIDNITKLMRQRVKDSVSFLHVGKTIARAIDRGGFFDPVKEARTRQSEYLILIDEYNSNSQQVKIFEYLALMLKRHNVLTEVFYYRKEPKFCYSINEPQGISLEKLYNKYQRHILLIFGEAYQLINTTDNSFDKTYEALLNHWKHKAIITPVSFSDWQQKEKNIILPNIPIVPADMEGLVLLAEMLIAKENDVDIISRLKNSKGVFYRTAGINFENINALIRYCNDANWAISYKDGKQVNVLFEWIAALAVYPKIRWEITLAVGKAILEKYGLAKELNYTTLLRVVRISWMKNGVMPDALRFELLKKLSLDNEKIARETILLLLKEIPEQEVDNNTGNVAEKEIQQIINEFTLYANDPVYYSSYRQSKYMFEKLWKEKQVKDLPTEQYFKNEGQQWKTLINKRNYNTEAISNTGVEEYLQSTEKEETILSKVYAALAIISLLVFLTSIAALRILYIWDNFLQ
ncbi:hypothetical protein [Ferruginibacter sp.]|nr:hypothetical protein [Ferruginibacter sp.]